MAEYSSCTGAKSRSPRRLLTSVRARRCPSSSSRPTRAGARVHAARSDPARVLAGGQAGAETSGCCAAVRPADARFSHRARKRRRSCLCPHAHARAHACALVAPTRIPPAREPRARPPPQVGPGQEGDGAHPEALLRGRRAVCQGGQGLGGHAHAALAAGGACAAPALEPVAVGFASVGVNSPPLHPIRLRCVHSPPLHRVTSVASNHLRCIQFASVASIHLRCIDSPPLHSVRLRC
eukprot:3921677-Prymnesium_polylepis.1